MSEHQRYENLDEGGIALLAEVLALKCRAGDVIALRGDLGAGKTTFARAFIRSVLGDMLAEVPSPTFPIVQLYEAGRFDIRHFDLYRVSDPDELIEIGFSDGLDTSVTLVEWPENAGPVLPEDRIEVEISEHPDRPDARIVGISVFGHNAPTGALTTPLRIGRVLPLFNLLAPVFPSDTGSGRPRHLTYLQGDASSRAYGRITGGFGSRIVMDSPPQPDGPPVRHGLSYSQVAHLAEDIRPFIAISDTLLRAGFSTPRCEAVDLEAGVAVFEDLGNEVFGSANLSGISQSDLWASATDVLLAIREAQLPRTAVAMLGNGKTVTHALP
ncbi:MAG TPA: tRNA (adenosine(37)-N6)-threonylcarbamoyltransferase complex ATPase subunit type 1 TsaE, partial [Hyphomicrobiaceae bacterium]|nr:tRNA (adenosine(37)-N6)-threonylcarbamoyltransferase complex ATPase subunit type 1 TsaE [Hyphomicrobiaceae bacterium]